jgi:hypothetical protein
LGEERTFSPGVKLPGSEVAHSPTDAEVKEKPIYISPLPYVFMS